MVRRLSIKTMERALWIGQIVLIIAIVATVVRGFRRVQMEGTNAAVAASEPTSESDSPKFDPQSSDADALKPLVWYEPLWQRDLRQPPIPPVAKPTPVATPKPVPMPTLPRLMGTFVEGETAWAHLISPQVGVRVLRVHDRIDGFEIGVIEPGRIQLTWNDQARWLEIERPKSVIAQRP